MVVCVCVLFSHLCEVRPAVIALYVAHPNGSLRQSTDGVLREIIRRRPRLHSPLVCLFYDRFPPKKSEFFMPE